MCNLSLVRPFTIALTLTLTLQTFYARAVFDIGEGREDPLIVALQKYEPKLWSSSAADILALINREGTCTLIQFLSKDANGNPDIQLDGQGNLITRDKYGKKLAELRKLSAARLKQDLGIVVALAARVETLNPDTRKQFNVALYGPGYEKGPQNDADRNRGAQRLKDAVLELGQYRDAKKVETLQAKARQSAPGDAEDSTSLKNAKVAETPLYERERQRTGKSYATKGMAQRTLEAWNAYQTLEVPPGPYWKQFDFQRKAIRLLNLQNVDPDLITYYRLLEQKLTEIIPVAQAWETEEAKEDQSTRNAAGRDAECQRAYELHQPCERDAGDALTVWNDFLKFSGRRSAVSGTAERKWKPIYDRIEAKYDSDMASSLRRVEIKYEFDCYSSVFDKQANDFYRAALDYVDKKMWAEAIVPLKSALRVNPNHLWAHGELGDCYVPLGQFELALDELNEQLRLNPNRKTAQFGRGVCYYRLRRYSEAVGPLQEVIRLDPEFADAYYCLGLVYLAMGNRNAALAQYRILQRIDANAAADLYKEISKPK